MNSLLIVDFEATCDASENHLPRHKMEIIEIGAIKVSIPDFVVLDEYQRLVKPLRTPILTNFCKELTGIQQSDVERADIFYNVASDFFEWCWKKNEPIAWCSWGMYDYHQIDQDCSHYNIDNDLLLIEYINLKNSYGDAFNGRRRGLKNATIEQRIEFQGRHHRALDDTINALNIIKKMESLQRIIMEKII